MSPKRRVSPEVGQAALKSWYQAQNSSGAAATPPAGTPALASPTAATAGAGAEPKVVGSGAAPNVTEAGVAPNAAGTGADDSPNTAESSTGAVLNPAESSTGAVAGKGDAALALGTENNAPRRSLVMTAVRYSLEELAARQPGASVEVRVPPAGAVQVKAGTRHRRGTPPAVVEMSMQTWLELACGLVSWESAVNSGQVQASGEGATLAGLVPIFSHAAGTS